MSDRYEMLGLAQLSPGMVLADALLDAQGKVLLAEGVVLNETTIRALARHGVGAAPIARTTLVSEAAPAAIQQRLDHVFRHHSPEDNEDWASGLLRRHIEDYRHPREVTP